MNISNIQPSSVYSTGEFKFRIENIYSGDSKDAILVIQNSNISKISPIIDAIAEEQFNLASINLKNLGRLEAQDFNLSLMRYNSSAQFYANIQSFEISNVSQEKQFGSVLDISQLFRYNKKLSMFRLSSNNFAVRLPLFLKVEQFKIENQAVESEKMDIYLHQLNATSLKIIWAPIFDDKKLFFPEILAPKHHVSISAELYNTLRVDRSINICKNNTVYGWKMAKLYLPISFERIEYGTLSTAEKFVTNLLGFTTKDGRKSSQGMTFTPPISFNWIQGECEKLLQNLNQTSSNSRNDSRENEQNLEANYWFCETCFMHQYGYRRKADNVRQFCEGVSFSLNLALSLLLIKCEYLSIHSSQNLQLHKISEVILNFNSLSAIFPHPSHFSLNFKNPSFV